MENRRERTNRRLAQATIQEVLHQPMFRATVVTCSRTHQGMDTDGLENGGSPQKKSPKKPINMMCLGEESTDDPHTVRQQHHRPKADGASKGVRDGVANDTRDRVLMSSPLGQAVR